MPCCGGGLNLSERKNPLTLECYAELRDWFRDLHYNDQIKAVAFALDGGNFSPGGDVYDIIGPLIRMKVKKLQTFPCMIRDLVKAIVKCGK